MTLEQIDQIVTDYQITNLQVQKLPSTKMWRVTATAKDQVAVTAHGSTMMHAVVQLFIRLDAIAKTRKTETETQI